MQAIVLASLLLLVSADEPRQTVIVVVGAAGNEEYGKEFAAWADQWEAAAKQANANFLRVGGEESESGNSDREQLQQHLQRFADDDAGVLWLVLIGHGTFDGQQAKFNLRGPDITAAELAGWMQPIETPLAIVNCASSSGPFVNELAGPQRVVITATRSGAEQNYARFGQYLAAAIADPSIDLDKDGQTSLLEAYLAASSKTQEFYQQEQRLATEHALLDDNGDALGTPADWFRGFRAVRSAKDGSAVDGERAAGFVLVRGAVEAAMSEETRGRRDQLESEISELRSRKSELAEDHYFRDLETLVLELARLYRDVGPAKE